MLRVFTATSATARLNAAADFLADRPPSSEVVIVGASRGAADDFARAIARRAGATFGLMRFSLTELAARAAAVRLAGASRAPLTQAGAEATAARVVFDALGAERARILRPGRLDARLSQGARADASRAAPRSDRARPLDGVQRRSGSGPGGFAGGPRYRAPAGSCRRTNGSCGCQRSRGAVSPRS